ncbi:MAG: hypothetical protein JXA90_11415 [Planctomycetes bacterium]|nr:hypothetical protein [Planctomycetota bacterium]
MTPGRALLAMRLSRLRNHIFSLQKDSVAKLFVVIFGLTNIVLLGLWISFVSFRFIGGFYIGGDLTAKLISLLFFSLMILVTLSTILISYVAFFIANETEFFFQHPVPPRTVLFSKTVEAVSISTWASLFLGLPVLVSFGVVRQSPPLYYLEMALILATFLVFAGLLGIGLTLLLTPLFKRLTLRMLVLGALLVLAALAWVFFRSFEYWAMDGDNNLLVLDRFMSGLRAMQSPFSPSFWASTAVLSASSGNHGDAMFYGALLLANTVIFWPVLSVYGRHRFGREWLTGRGMSRSFGTRSKQPRPRGSLFGRSPLSALVAKDLLIFVRNPAQLSQSILFLLLMVIYSLSLFRLPLVFTSGTLKLVVHFANLGAVSMILSAFSARFIFPLLSLEGKAFWIVGLAPMPRSHLLRQKALFGLAVSSALGLLTIAVSNMALASSPAMFAAAIYATLLASICLTCLATGLGAAYPSFGEDNPARIAAGLGGTLNFFASALSVAAIVLLEALPYLIFGPRIPAGALAAAHALSLLFTASVSVFALRLGGRALARSEF